MKFSQSRDLPTREIGYAFSFEFVDQETRIGSGLVDATLCVEFGQRWQPPIDLLFDGSEELFSSEMTVSLSDREIRLPLQLLFGTADDRQQLVIQMRDAEGNGTTVQIPIPSPRVLGVFQKWKDTGSEPEILEKLEESYGNRVMYKVLKDASQCLETTAYFEIKDVLAAQSKQCKRFIDKTRIASFRNMVSGSNKGRFHQVTSVTELQEAIEVYNELPHLADITFDQVVHAILDEVCDSGDLTGYRHVLTSQGFIEQCGEIAEDEFCNLLAQLIDADEMGTATRLVETWVPEPGYDEYEVEKEQLLDENPRNYETKAAGFRDLLYDAVRSTEREFMFIATNYLFWRAKQYSEEHERLDIQPQLFRVAADLADDIGIPPLQKRAEYQSNLTKGHQLRPEDNYGATARYRDAMAIGQELGRDYYVLPPLRYLAETEVWIHKDREEYTEGIDRLESHLELVEESAGVDPGQKEYTRDLLQGWLHDLKAHERLQEAALGTAINAADDELEQAVKRFGKASRDELRDGAIARRHELDAISAKLDGDFEKAANFHEKYVLKLPESNGSEYHEAEKWICRVKSALLAGDYETAQEHIQNIEENLGFLHNRYRAIELLTEIVVDYAADRATDARTVYTELYNREADDHFLEIDRDYTTALTQILAAQRLQRWSIDQELLDVLVDHALRDALIPKDVEDLAPEKLRSDISLEDLSIDRFWRQKLPLNVRDKLQTAELTAQTSPDWDTPIEPLMRALERQLAAVVEYHGKQYWGSNWKQKLIGETDKSAEEINIGLGPLFEFFEMDAGQQLPIAECVRTMDRNEIMDGVSIKDIRDDLAHGNKLRVAETEAEYRQIRDAIFELMKVLIDETPVPSIVDKALPLSNSYYIRLLWKAPTDRVLLQAGCKLTDEQVYYLPPNSIGSQELLELKADEVVVCDDHRGLDGYLPT